MDSGFKDKRSFLKSGSAHRKSRRSQPTIHRQRSVSRNGRNRQMKNIGGTKFSALSPRVRQAAALSRANSPRRRRKASTPDGSVANDIDKPAPLFTKREDKRDKRRLRKPAWQL